MADHDGHTVNVIPVTVGDGEIRAALNWMAEMDR